MDTSSMIYVFDGTLDGFFTLFFESFENNTLPYDIVEENYYQQSLDARYFYIDTNTEKADKVYNAIQKRISGEAFKNVYYAFMSSDEKRFTSIFYYLKKGFIAGKGVDSCQQDEHAAKVHKLVMYVKRETHYWEEFLRFTETEHGFYYASISPVNHILEFLAHNFSERFKDKAFVIHDKTRSTAAVYGKKHWIIVDVPEEKSVTLSGNEKKQQELWISFFKNIALGERRNIKRQRGNIQRYQKYAVDFNSF